ncbi:putative ABC transport system ATP-binding protein [Leucobacter luti]|uniref:ABC transporter ATP-binding protein n=1 Tax=Leucobacter luti TaxID=340320 RepID=UPI0010EFC232|nr:ABC transporter ATP-binding protein [Leucobacter luti]MCW2287650.1 putative ABC transport system ATP-binding protein [Leucobacter luti]TCK46185.1 putative ABC transport system ATP-binding protein [Leucobacter luti]
MDTTRVDPTTSPPAQSREQRWLLQARGAGKSFGGTRALIDAAVSIAPGESVAITGPSGSGKSTLLHVLAGILPAEHGGVFLRRGDGSGSDNLVALSDAARSAIRLRRFGFVFQQGLLLPELTAMENVALPLLLAGASRAVANTRAVAELQRLGLAGLEARRIGQLSGGQAQRVAIARALVADPSVIFADEPTGALDSHTADEVLEVLLATGPDAHRALLIVTHDAQVASRCDRVIRLRDGRIEGAA